ncbi:MAG: AraC family transcriptional regulator [Aphanocapsa sp. GSE-SYN-MK-11-07L]|jgi:AraC-like DNA-binding protein|nr:AraC family transcriptional regulator [Aphanocapsa sp. GSE-SYN-MK-11-07L]
MTLFLSETELYQEFLQQPDKPNSDTWTGYLNDPRQLSQGYRQYIDLCSGLDLQIDDYILDQDLVVENAATPPENCLELSFSVWGDNRTEGVAQGQNFLQAYICDQTPEGFFAWKAGDRVLKLDIHMEFEFFATLINAQYDQLPLELARVLQSNQIDQYWQIAKTTATMQAIVHQILTCPFEGAVRRLYLEAKVLELIALRLQQFQDDAPDLPIPYLSPTQIEQLHRARKLLLSQLENPPSILELARQVGMNHNRLKQGFRALFGTTVFGCMFEHRMQVAVDLLRNNTLTIANVANTVGYANAAKFSSAFKRKYGITPSACRAGQKLL